ncbi:chaperonin CPN60-1, mitochondrial-like isoform X1 [Prunus dulcis]|uniref:chaperonin CPN60-1, mitochondrial-like isoform X1 n=1 Tax=Prunus dulcis TaxID=3755 RepID=UPI0014835064|nr:chaperonin CPN60-1, mitochondrial-like isoform X1 [Prunus dulcis]
MEMKMMEAALQGAARQAQAKADEIAKFMNENEQLKSAIEDLKEGDAAVAVAEEVKKNNHVVRKLEKRQHICTLDQHIEEQFGCGRLLACISSRPGQWLCWWDGKTLDNELEVVEGMKLDRGYISPYFITNQNNQKCELENPLIIIHEKKISSINDVVKVLELVLQVSISLVRFTSFFVFTMNWLTNFCSFSEAKL